VKSGELVWRKSLTDEMGGSEPNWGYTESPLIDGDQVVCTPGGAKGAVAALNKKTGELLWQSSGFQDGAQYSSLSVSGAGGVRQYVQLTDKSVAGVAAKDGKVLWRHNRPGKITIPTPICFGDFVYVTSGYGIGCNLLKLTPEGDGMKVKEEYANTNVVNHHGGVVLLDGHIYGHSDSKGWVCQDVKTGEVVWSSRALGKGSMTCADGCLICYSEDKGVVTLVPASTKEWKETGRFKIPVETSLERKRGKIWTHPVVADGKLYLRDQDLIFCYDLKDQSAR
jgi:outer membrane protein assembly factor BamB